MISNTDMEQVVLRVMGKTTTGDPTPLGFLLLEELRSMGYVVVSSNVRRDVHPTKSRSCNACCMRNTCDILDPSICSPLTAGG